MQDQPRPGPRVHTTTASQLRECPESRLDAAHYRDDGQCLHTAPLTCQWFALCDRAADVYVSHPVLGWVPTCPRCLEKARDR